MTLDPIDLGPSHLLWLQQLRSDFDAIRAGLDFVSDDRNTVTERQSRLNGTAWLCDQHQAKATAILGAITRARKQSSPRVRTPGEQEKA